MATAVLDQRQRPLSEVRTVTIPRSRPRRSTTVTTISSTHRITPTIRIPPPPPPPPLAAAAAPTPPRHRLRQQQQQSSVVAAVWQQPGEHISIFCNNKLHKSDPL